MICRGWILIRSFLQPSCTAASTNEKTFKKKTRCMVNCRDLSFEALSSHHCTSRSGDLHALPAVPYSLGCLSSSISILPASKSSLIYCTINQYNVGKNDHYIQIIVLTWRCWLHSPIVHHLPHPLSSLQTKNRLVEVVNQCTSTTSKRDTVCIARRWPLSLPVFSRLWASCLSCCYGLQFYKLQSYGAQPYKLAAMHHTLFQSDRMVQNATDI